MNKTQYIILYASILLNCIFILVLLFGPARGHKNTISEKIIVDTVVVKDTVTFYKTDFKTKYVYDTVVINDTVWIKDEPRCYTDSTDSYKININAVKLYDYDLSIYRKDTVFKEVHTVEKQKRWCRSIGIGIQTGIGVNYDMLNRNFGVGPYIGVGVTYQFGYCW